MIKCRKGYNHIPQEVIWIRRRDRRGCLNMERRPPRRAFLDVDEPGVQEFVIRTSGEASSDPFGPERLSPSKRETLRRHE